MMNLEIKGADKLRRELERLAREYPRATGEAVLGEGLRIMAESKLEAPKRTGRLRDSAYVAGPEQSAEGPSVRIGYSAPHALKVHEATELRYRQGKAKFLEDPLKRATHGYLQRMAAGIRARLGG